MDLIGMLSQEPLQFFTIQFMFYIVFYLLPFIAYNVMQDPSKIGHILLRSGLCIQIILVFLEIPQVSSGPSQYFQDFWNLQDLTSFCLFCYYYQIQYENGFENRRYDFDEVIVGEIILLLTMIKILFYLRLSESIGGLVRMLIITITKVKTFMIFMLLSISYFGLATLIISAHFSLTDYPGVPIELSNFIQTFRNSIGDISLQDYSYWQKNANNLETW
jgi:hypothetical protein